MAEMERLRNLDTFYILQHSDLKRSIECETTPDYESLSQVQGKELSLSVVGEGAVIERELKFY